MNVVILYDIVILVTVIAGVRSRYLPSLDSAMVYIGK
jgi:hypothetical protein